MFTPETLPDKLKYISLLEAAKYSKVYSQEYLSLRARHGKLKAVKLGRNWVTTKSWVDDYINNENNVKANGAVYNFVEKEIQEIEAQKIKAVEPKLETVLIEQVKQQETAPTKEDVLLKKIPVFEEAFKRNFFEKFSKKFAYSLGAILLVIGIVFSSVVLSPNDLPGQLKSFVINQFRFFSGIETQIHEAKSASAVFLTESFKNLSKQKIIFKEIGLQFKNIFKDIAKIYSEKTREILGGINRGASYVVSHSQRVKNIVLIFYDNPRYLVKITQEKMQDIQQQTSDAIAGFPVFIKDGFQENFYKLEHYFESSKPFLAEVENTIAQSNKTAYQKFTQTSKEVLQALINKVDLGAKLTVAAVKKAFFEAKLLTLYIHKKFNTGLSFVFGPWDHKGDLLVSNNIASNPPRPAISGSEEGGLIVIPSQGQTQDEEIKAKIRESFSDEIEVELKDADSGIITPVFKEKKGEGYLYLMVPIKN